MSTVDTRTITPPARPRAACPFGRLPFAIRLSLRARAIIRQNLYLSRGVIAVLIIATPTGVFGIGPAVLIHEGSTLVVIANALRLLLYEG